MARILLIEDDPLQRTEYARYLASNDGGAHEIHEARSATEAIRLISAISFDLILLERVLKLHKR